jgi:hypothetical protein
MVAYHGGLHSGSSGGCNVVIYSVLVLLVACNVAVYSVVVLLVVRELPATITGSRLGSLIDFAAIFGKFS